MKPKIIALAALACAAAGFGALAQPAGLSTGPGPGPEAPQGLQGPMGGVTLQQFQAQRLAQAMRADSDHDGRISLQEWMAAHPAGRGDPERQFTRMDANHDGYLTPDEIDAVLAVRFARLDANHDGVLSRDEIMAARTARPGEG